jgi:hypothetical protein
VVVNLIVTSCTAWMAPIGCTRRGFSFGAGDAEEKNWAQTGSGEDEVRIG